MARRATIVISFLNAKVKCHAWEAEGVALHQYVNAVRRSRFG
jgi:hypothetical protein